MKCKSLLSRGRKKQGWLTAENRASQQGALAAGEEVVPAGGFITFGVLLVELASTTMLLQGSAYFRSTLSNQKAPRRACQGLGPRRFDSTRLQRARVNEVSFLWFGYTAQNTTILSCTILYSGGSELTRPAVGASALNLN